MGAGVNSRTVQWWRRTSLMQRPALVTLIPTLVTATLLVAMLAPQQVMTLRGMAQNTADAIANTSARDTQPLGISAPHHAQPTNATRIIVLVDADEGVHLALDDDAAFEALPHPFAPKAISHAAHEALAAHGVAPGSTTFDAAEAIARAHPLLRPRVF